MLTIQKNTRQKLKTKLTKAEIELFRYSVSDKTFHIFISKEIKRTCLSIKILFHKFIINKLMKLFSGVHEIGIEFIYCWFKYKLVQTFWKALWQ